jgi:hypothetical protein
MEVYEKSQGEGFRRPRRNPKRELYGCNKTKKKSESKQVELGTESNDVGLAADPKYPISRLSKFVVGENGKNMADEQDRK